jgi:5-methylcytosine-specific restriction endonuclease McrA
MIDKPFDEFGKDKSRKDILNVYCKTCCKEIRATKKDYTREYNAEYRHKNSDKLREQGKIWREHNKDVIKKKKGEYYIKHKNEIALYNKEYYQNNRDRCLEKNYAYRQTNKESCLKISRNWKKNNPEKVREYNRRRRAKKVAVDENYTKEDKEFTLNIFNHRCFNCGDNKNLQIDHHYALSKGNALTRNNAVLLCRKCNQSKGNKTPEDFYTQDKLDILNVLLNKKLLK